MFPKQFSTKFIIASSAALLLLFLFLAATFDLESRSFRANWKSSAANNEDEQIGKSSAANNDDDHVDIESTSQTLTPSPPPVLPPSSSQPAEPSSVSLPSPIPSNPQNYLPDLPLPPDYSHSLDKESYCDKRFSTVYLADLRDSLTEYCTRDSTTDLTCFHSQTAENQRIDTFCLGRSSIYNVNDRRFVLRCNPIHGLRSNASFQVPEMNHFAAYMYHTGSGHIFENYISNIEEPTAVAWPKERKFSVLLSREGEGNPWHCLLEILSLTLSFDVLRMSRDPATNEPLFTEADMANTQIIVLDGRENGPYWDLWQLFAQKPILRLADLTEDTPIDNLIVPLAGGGNPIWQGDWHVQNCGTSELLRTFVARTLAFYNIESRSSPDKIVVTFIDRHEGRRLIDQDRLLELANTSFPHVEVQLRDFAALSFKDQIQAARDSDVFVGVHGAGLTHALWLKPSTSVVEILPHGLEHKGFRNLAQLLGHSYFSAHASENGGGRRRLRKRDRWHTEDVVIEEERWLHLIGAAVANVYNKRERNFDTA
jgi:protein O-GlcNAc transferase